MHQIRTRGKVVVLALILTIVPILFPAFAAADDGSAAGVQVETPGGGDIRVLSPGLTTITLLDTSGSPHEVALSVSGDAAGVLTVDEPATVMVEPSKPIPVTLISTSTTAKPVSGWLAITTADVGTQWKKITLGPQSDASAKVAAWPVTMTVAPWRGHGTPPALPLSGSLKCPTDGNLSNIVVATTILSRGSDTATVTANCPAGQEVSSLALSVTGLSAWTAGDYTGKLSLGGANVDLTVKRQASIWLFLFLLLLGSTIALLARAYLGWRPIWAFKKEIEDALKEQTGHSRAPSGPTPAWTKRCATLTEETRKSLTSSLEGHDSAGQRFPRPTRLFRWLCSPPSHRLELLTTAQAGLKDAERIAQEWNSQASSAIVKGLSGRSVLVGDLKVRADAIFDATADALKEPSEGAPARAGLTGLEAVLSEARGLATAITHSPTRSGLKPEGYAPATDEQEHADLAWIQDALLASTRRLPAWISALASAGSKHVVQWGDYLMFVVALVVVTWTGLITLYVGKGWGSGWDLAGVVVAAVSGSLVLTPLFQSVDRLGGAADRGGA